MSDNKKGLVFNIQKFSLHDGPGIRTNIFLKGCPLSCKWCSNPESQNPYINIFMKNKNKIFRIDLKDNDLNFDNDGYIIEDFKFKNFMSAYTHNLDEISYEQVARPISTDRILDICLQDKVFYENSNGGVTISGGEPSLQIDFLNELLTKLKKVGIHTAIETTVFNSLENLESLYDKIDLFIIDIKHRDSKTHKDYTSVSNDLILNNISQITKNAKDYLIRIPVIPGFNHSVKDAHEFVKLFKSLGIQKVQLLPFHQFGEDKYKSYGIVYDYKDVKAIEEYDLMEMINVFNKANINAFV